MRLGNLCNTYELIYLFAFPCMKCRKDGQDTHDELQKRNLRDELEERERRHFSSKDKPYNGEKKTCYELLVVFCFKISMHCS